MSESDRVRVEPRGRTLVVTLARPERRNALTRSMYAAVADALEHAAEAPSVRSVLVRGEGESFCSGNDVSDFLTAPELDERNPAVRLLRLLVTFPKPLVAAVHGHAVGIGTTLLLHCDLVVATEQATFQLPFVRLGLVPEAASSLLLPALAGHRVAFEYLVCGERFGAARARELGVVNAVVPAAELEAEVERRLGALERLPPEAVRQAKALLKGRPESLLERMEEELKVFASRMGSPETMEAVSAFLQKRDPDFDRFA